MARLDNFPGIFIENSFHDNVCREVKLIKIN